jgi:hypothetical protein
MWTDGGASWVRYGTAVRCIDDEAFALDVAAAVEPDETVHAVRMLDGGAIVVCAHPQRRTTMRAVDARGRLRWARPLHVDPETLRRSHGRAVDDVVPSYGSELAVTAGLAVACLESSLSGIAVCFGVARPTVPCAGRRDLHPVRLGDTWFVAEQSNDLSEPMYWARWNTDGTIDRGPRLPGYYMTPPVAVDGCAYFARLDGVWCARADLTAEIVATFPDEGTHHDPSWGGSAVSEDGTVYLARASRNGSSAIWLVRP